MHISSVNFDVDLGPGTTKVPVEFELQNPKLWWTNGLGEAYLYDFTFNLIKDNVVTDKYFLFSSS
ncbi:hypothetical protein QA597_02125 [Marinilabiliaceae bacterium ANBcel2]|nr:hypothetical protein [Marinilabiliaceae bacterium ANBcel2]